MQTITAEQSNAFIEQFIAPPTRPGPLDGLSFAVKDLIDVAGHTTGCGNPTWLATHAPAAVSAVCIEQLLAAGASCHGKTITDEIAFSLLGENYFYGTPLNPAAFDRVPGGSSSGSASAVACGLVDFAVGTDTGGSVRVPASNCGIFGLRPSHGIISVAGVMPFSPTFDTVGLFARDLETLTRAARCLVPNTDTATTSVPPKIYLVSEAFTLCNEDVRQAFSHSMTAIQKLVPNSIEEISLSNLCSSSRAGDMATWLTIYRVLQGTEIMSCLGTWIATSQAQFGPAPSTGLELVAKIDRTRIQESIQLREYYSRHLNASLVGGKILCFPTAPTIAPLKGSNAHDRSQDYYQRALSLNAIAGVARLPQISLPLGNVGGVPIGLSLAAAHGADIYLLEVAKTVLNTIVGTPLPTN